MSLNIMRKESLDRYLGEDKLFVKSMNARDLMAIGIGTVIGTGIFILLEQLPQIQLDQECHCHFCFQQLSVR